MPITLKIYRLVTLALVIASGSPMALALPQSSAVPGGIVAIKLNDNLAVTPKAYFQKKPVSVIQHESAWYAVLGLNLNIKVGDHFVTSQGKRYPFTVTDKQYEEQHITLKTRKHIDLSEADLNRHRGEKAKAQAVFKAFDETTPLDLDFVKPVKGPYSSPFGLKRFYNGEPRNPHSGLDIAAPTGTPILAPSTGKVVLTGDFFFNGNVVYVDHGQGVISMFCHLSKIQVKEGDTLEKGQKLGEVGATGRVTGPHLHWSVSMNNARIDPMLLMKNP